MAIATRSSHVLRAIEFFKRNDKFFGIGGTSPWDNETSPPAPSTDTYDISNLIGLRKVDTCYLVVPDEVNGSIEYRGAHWRVVPEVLNAVVDTAVSAGSYSVKLKDLLGLTVGSKVRVNKSYVSVIQSIDSISKTIVLNDPAPAPVPADSPVVGGAIVEGARWVYIDTYLRYEQFPLVTYRQIGVYTYTLPVNLPTMLSAAYSSTSQNEFTTTGYLEILDNRKPTPRDEDQKELLALIVEF